MNTYPTKLMEAFAAQALEIFYKASVSDQITNNDYEGEIRNKSSKLNVLTFGAISSHAYTGADMSVDSVEESNCQLVTDQAKYFYFKIKDYDTFRSYIKDPENPIRRQVGNELKKVVDTFVLGLYGDAGAGNWDGTSYATGTVTITATTGAVVGAGTTFAEDMEGKPFKADGHTTWYRVKTFTDTTHITIEDDSDDLTSAYTGGAIAGSSSYEIQANTAVQFTASNAYTRVLKLKAFLSNQEIPDEDRWLVVPTDIANLIRQADEYVGIGSEGGRQAVMNGMLPGEFGGFRVFEVSSSRISGNSSDGFWCMAGHKSAITFAMGLTEQGIEDLIGNFGKAYKSLYVYGAKVADERRKALAVGYWKL